MPRLDLNRFNPNHPNPRIPQGTSHGMQYLPDITRSYQSWMANNGELTLNAMVGKESEINKTVKSVDLGEVSHFWLPDVPLMCLRTSENFLRKMSLRDVPTKQCRILSLARTMTTGGDNTGTKWHQSIAAIASALKLRELKAGLTSYTIAESQNPKENRLFSSNSVSSKLNFSRFECHPSKIF